MGGAASSSRTKDNLRGLELDNLYNSAEYVSNNKLEALASTIKKDKRRRLKHENEATLYNEAVNELAHLFLQKREDPQLTIGVIEQLEDDNQELSTSSTNASPRQRGLRSSVQVVHSVQPENTILDSESNLQVESNVDYTTSSPSASLNPAKRRRRNSSSSTTIGENITNTVRSNRTSSKNKQ